MDNENDNNNVSGTNVTDNEQTNTNITDKILPNVVTTGTSPKPIVVITENEYHNEST